MQTEIRTKKNSYTNQKPVTDKPNFPKMINGKVEVIAKNGSRLMPCVPVIARLLLKQKKAKIVAKKPFTIKLKYKTETLFMQERPDEEIKQINDIESAKNEYKKARKKNMHRSQTYSTKKSHKPNKSNYFR